MVKSDLTVELIIPSYNRLEILKGTLKKIRKLYPNLKICLGLQGQIPDSSFQSYLARDSHVRVENFPAPSTTKALNSCISTSAADIILILDDDAVPCSGWLEAHRTALTERPDLAYTSGREIRISRRYHAFSEGIRILVESICGLFLKNDMKINGRIVGWVNGIGLLFGNFDQPGTCKINSPRGCNMALRKESFIKVGKFNEYYIGNAWGFEADFGLRLAKECKYGQYLGNSVVIHHEVASGGSRTENKTKWFQDYFHNHKLLVRNIGPLAWIGSIPRLIKHYF